MINYFIRINWGAVGKKVTPVAGDATKSPIPGRPRRGADLKSREVNEMQVKTYLFRIALVASMGIIWGSGCASSSAESPSSQVHGSGIYIKQEPMTSYMRSQVGTPDELSPLAPAAATNVQKVGNHWTCDLNGQAMIFNEASSCWEPQGK
jgi:hypothetical protein